MRKFTMAGITVLLILLFSGCELSRPFYTTKIHGLFIGLDYQNSDVNDLHGTIPDATEMAGAFHRITELYQIPFDGYLALQEGSEVSPEHPLYPSANNIFSLIEHIGNEMDNNDLFIFYYAGHGDISDDQDATTGILATARDGESSRYTTVTVTALREALAALPGNKVVILDSCHSGAYVAEYPLDQVVEQTLYDPSQFYLTSTHIDETAKETSVGTHFHGKFSSELLTYLEWDHEGTTQASVYYDSLIEKGTYDVVGEISDLSDLDEIITLRDLEDATDPQFGQEALRTSGPRDIILLNRR
ncbi:MAG: caspase family protein [Sphaerochaetaceae bacterium]|nr:caspase family protein [Sphaerochaetaceae bacterium]